MPVVVYTDASGEGRIGAVLFVDGVRHTVHTRAPEWFMSVGAGIFELELLAELLGLMLACEIVPGRPGLLCCDNTGAAATVVRGTCRTVLGGIIGAVFRATAAQFRCSVWVEGVVSGLNPSDDPSRVCPRIPLGSRFKGSLPSGGIPVSFFRMCESRHALAAAQFVSQSQVKGRGPGWQCPERGGKSEGVDSECLKGKGVLSYIVTPLVKKKRPYTVLAFDGDVENEEGLVAPRMD